MNDESLRRWMSSCPPAMLLDRLLREKADWEKTGGERTRALMGDDDPQDDFEICGPHDGVSWKLAVMFNMLGALAAEVCLKGIAAGRGGSAHRTHDLIELHEGLEEGVRDKLQREYQALVLLAETEEVGKAAEVRQLEEVLARINGKFVAYRYLEDMEEIEAHDWWSVTLSVKALQNAAATWVTEAPWPEEHPHTLMLSDPRLTGCWKNILRQNTKAWMKRILGNDLQPNAGAKPEDAAWHGT